MPRQGDTAELPFTIDVEPGVILYFSYASMVLPSNDAFVSNGDPTANIIFDADGAFVPVTIESLGSEVLDAGTEVNDELPDNTAFFGQIEPNTGKDENGVVLLHGGFNPAGSGGILDDPQFVNADFTADGYGMMTISVTAQQVKEVDAIIRVTNGAPANGTCQTPVWVGIHAGTFDTYNRSEAAPDFLVPLVEDGNNVPITEAFANTTGAVWDSTVGMAPICPGETVELPFTITPVPGVTHYFSYASMVLPSNDAFVSNGDPMAHEVFTADGEFVPVMIESLGSEVLDAGTEVNDELPDYTAFFGQMQPNTGENENGVVDLHPGFNAVGSGGILDDPRFANADFTAKGYQMMTIQVTMEEPPEPPVQPPVDMPVEAPTSAAVLAKTGFIAVVAAFVAMW
jgi:hypothetical protein